MSPPCKDRPTDQIRQPRRPQTSAQFKPDMPGVTFCQTETESQFEISYSFNPGEDISLDIFGWTILKLMKRARIRMRLMDKDGDDKCGVVCTLAQWCLPPTMSEATVGRDLCPFPDFIRNLNPVPHHMI